MAAKIDDMTSKMESLYLPGSPIRGYYSTSQTPVADVYPGLSRTNSWNSSSDQSNREMPIRGYYSTSQTPAADVYPGLSRTNSWNSSSDQSNRRMSLSAPSLPPGALEAPDLLSLQYLTHLVQEQKQLTILFPKMFTHVERLLETGNSEIARVREALFQNDFNIFDIELPEPDGPLVNITEKLYIPVRAFPEYNFVGRILGPRGMTAKQLEQETGCRIMVRGRGSMKDKRKEDAHRGRPNWEHLEDDLHVLIQCEDAENRCQLKLASAVAHIGRLLVPTPDGSDDLKRKQLMELAIINGTYRPYHRQQRETKTLLPLLSVSSADPFSSLF